ncbi:MAG: hypothetical protein ABI855_11670 [Bacteroidota bacterium]
MALPNLNIILTPAQLAALDAALSDLETNVSFRVNIPADDKNDEQAMNVIRYPYVQKVVETYAPSRPDLMPGFLRLVDGQNDFTLYNQLASRIARIQGILESYIDTQWLAGTEAYNLFFRPFYNQVDLARKNNVPGTDAIWNDLKGLYEEQGGPGPGPTT